ncbi:MAG: NHL repeat-containing protein [Gemmatimonadaceae bacterium]|nr:NHL repeat-containing protein [Gemmatimonadaceae bacterium]
MKPIARLGAASPFGLALPSAQPTASQMYGPRGVWFDDEMLVVADSGNHRVLIWHGIPSTDGSDADVVLGQPDFTSEGPREAAHGLHLPTGVLVVEGNLCVADAWHHRVLVWDGVPRSSDVAPAYVIGQQTMADGLPNRGGDVTDAGLYWPYGIGWHAGTFWIADTGNRRVLGYRGLPTPDQPPEIVLGQADFSSNAENRGADVSAGSFRWPHAITGIGDALYVADAGNHRVLGWSPLPVSDGPATMVIGQPDFTSNTELPHRKQGAHRMRFPYGIASDGDLLAVGDTANNRVLFFPAPPPHGAGVPAAAVIGQADFDAAGENRWKAVADDTLCWPYGLWMHGGRLAIADSGNNRVMLWATAGITADLLTTS